jgi:hypothetical protein
MATFTLDELRAEVEREFAPLTITLSDGTDCTMRHLLRLPGKVREQVVETLKLLEPKEGEDQDVDATIDAATTILKLVSDNGAKLAKELDGDVAMTMKVLERWMASTQVGEATPSDS